LSLSSRSGDEAGGSGDRQTSLLPASSSNGCQLLLVPLGFGSGSRDQAGDSACNRKACASVLQGSGGSKGGQLLLVPLSLSSGSGDEASGSGDRQ